MENITKTQHALLSALRAIRAAGMGAKLNGDESDQEMVEAIGVYRDGQNVNGHRIHGVNFSSYVALKNAGLVDVYNGCWFAV